MALILTFVFHLIIRNNLIDNLPELFRSRFALYKEFDWSKRFFKNYFIIILSILAGAASHLFWDAFTHSTGYFVNIIPILNNNFFIWDKELKVFNVLQHASSLIGMVAILWVIWKLPREKTEKTSKFQYWLVVFIVFSLTLLFRFLSGINFSEYGNIIVSIIAAGMLSLIVAGITQNVLVNLSFPHSDKL